MPLAKHRPNFSELLVIAAKQREKVDTKQAKVIQTVLLEIRKKSTLRRTISRGSVVKPIDDQEEEKEREREKDKKPATHTGGPITSPKFSLRSSFSLPASFSSAPSSSGFLKPNEITLTSSLMFSTRINSYLSSTPSKLTRIIAVTIAVCSLAMESSTNKYSKSLYLLDTITDIYFILFGLLKILSWYAKGQIKQLVHGKIEYWDLFKYTGITDVLFSALSLSFGHSYVGQWFRLVRMLTISMISLQQLPHIDVLVSGISIGVKSLISTWLLLTLVFFVYAAWAFVLFGKNDPSHFGSMAMSVWTLFQFSTMDNWSEVLYINMYGCDQYPPSDYVPYTNSSILSISRYGDMLLSVCRHPEPRPLLASVLLISFILLCGFILVSLTVASVTSGINERLKELEVDGEEMHQQEAAEIATETKTEGQAHGGGHGHGKGQGEKGQDQSDSVVVTDAPHGSPAPFHRSFSHLLRGESLSRLPAVSGAVSPQQQQQQQQQRSLLTHPEMLLMVLLQLWRKEELFLASTTTSTQPLVSPPSGHSRSAKYAATPSPTDTAGAIAGRALTGGGSLGACLRYVVYRLRVVWGESLSCVLAFGEGDVQAMSIHMRALTNHPLYKYLLAIAIASAALIEIISLEGTRQHGGQGQGQGQGQESEEERMNVLLRVIQICLQIFFTGDVIAQVLSHYPSWESYFTQRWNQYDVSLILITWIPILATGLSSATQKYLVLLRVLRILRLLRLLSWIPELNIIMRAISSSAIALFYVILLVFLFFFHFAIAGVLLFKTNDPQHFKTFYRAMVSLFQIATLDNWSDIARTNMYGCDFYGYDTGDLEYDSQCEHPSGLGWFAAWYFALFIVFGVFVLISLFVGVIITSMELLREGVAEENEVWRKVKLLQNKAKDVGEAGGAVSESQFHSLNDASIDNLLEIFNLVDTGHNGKLTFHELKPLLELVSISEVDQHQLFVLVDTDKSGQIDFSEFIELVYHMGKRYKQIRSHALSLHTRNSNGSRGSGKQKENPQQQQQAQAQEPRRLSRAGEEYFACLAEDRLRIQREEQELEQKKDEQERQRQRQRQEKGKERGEFSDLQKAVSGEPEGKSDCEGEGEQQGEGDDSSASEGSDHGHGYGDGARPKRPPRLGVVAPQAVY